MRGYWVHTVPGTFRRAGFLVCAVSALTVLANAAAAQTLNNAFGGLSESSDKPIDIESDLLTIYPEDYATFSGNVKAIQGTTTLRAREIKVNYVGGEQVESTEPAANTGESGDAAADEEGGAEPALTGSSSEGSAVNSQSARAIEEPIDIASDWMLVNDKEKYAQFKGNVKFAQGTTRLLARELTISYAGSDTLSASAQTSGGVAASTQITKMEAKGDVRALFMPTGSADQDATSGSGEFDLASATNKPAGAESEPTSTSNEGAGAPPQTTVAGGDTASVASAGPEENDNGGVTKIEAKGDVVITSEKNETTTSDWLIYDLPLQLVTVGGNVVLTQNDNVVKGDRLAIDLKSGRTRLENTGNASAGSGRIRALFLPKDAGDKPGKAKRKNGGGAAAPSPAPQ